MTTRVVVVGAGIVGTAIAAELTAHRGVAVTVLERGPEDRLVGSTGHAPGFVGLVGESRLMTDLAVASAEVYDGVRRDGVLGFDRVGGLEIATSEAGWARLSQRAELAARAGLPARLLTPSEAAASAPLLVDADGCVGGLLFDRDGTARAGLVTSALRRRAARSGATFHFDTTVEGLETVPGGALRVRTGDRSLLADEVVIACGIWGADVTALAGVALPLVPVAHPYVHGPPRPSVGAPSPFVRWPEHHVYARDHGDRLGLGSYDHAPVPASTASFGRGAEVPWSADLERVVDAAQRLLPEAHRFEVDTRLNGVFSMTPDNRPYLGPVPDVPGLWVAEALWVTHAAGAAHHLVRWLTGGEPLVDLEPLAPDRFAGRDGDDLVAAALRLYRDIYTEA